MSSAAFRVVFAQFLVALLVADNDTWQCDGDCPLWTTADSNSCECKCGSDLDGKVICEDGKGATALRNCFCMTTREDKNVTLVGLCYNTCIISNDTHYKLATRRREDLDNKSCTPFNRKGFLCSECIEGYGLPVYSYSISCVECSESDHKHNWARYIAVAYLPLTVFCFVVIIFRIPATSGWLVGYVALSQMMTIQGFVTWYLQNLKKMKKFAKFGVTIVSVWNLDFFRSLHSPFCLPHLSALDIFMLDYLVALYPLMLIFLTYLLVKLHDRFALVSWLCRPLYTCFHHFRKEWDIKTSLIGTFATFYLLSYVKVVNVTADILTSISLENTNGLKEKNLYVYYNASLRYFGEEHQKYAIFAVLFSFFFNVCPLLLLLLYPCGCFHRCLNRTGCRCHTLHIFMDAMLGAYSHRPRERRYFGAFYFILRIAHVLAFSVLDPFTYIKSFSYATAIVIALVLVFRPYKSKMQNVIDVVLFYSVLHSYSSIICLQLGKLVQPESRNNIIIFISLCVSISVLPLYGILVLTKRVTPWKVISKAVFELCKGFKKSYELEESLPDALEHGMEDCLVEGVQRHKHT